MGKCRCRTYLHNMHTCIHAYIDTYVRDQMLVRYIANLAWLCTKSKLVPGNTLRPPLPLREALVVTLVVTVQVTHYSRLSCGCYKTLWVCTHRLCLIRTLIRTITHTHDMSHTNHMTHMSHVGEASHVSETHGGARAYGDSGCFGLESMHPHSLSTHTSLVAMQAHLSRLHSLVSRVRCHRSQVVQLSGLKIRSRMRVTAAWPRRIPTMMHHDAYRQWCITTHTDNMHHQHPHGLCAGPIGRAAAFSQPGLLGKNGATLNFLASPSVASILVTHVRRSRRTGYGSRHLAAHHTSTPRLLDVYSTLHFLLNLPKIIYICTYTCIRIYIYICIHIHTSVWMGR